MAAIQTITLNQNCYHDKVYACWQGKNVGGTMGTPFENKPGPLSVTGYTTPKGEPLPNDDLDLQLVWLRAMEEVGPAQLNPNHLAWYWTRYIYPDWNEYGISKNNLKMGFLPPMSGELNNQAWRNSNGAWIRSEIWACLAPGCPDIAVKYAVMDACVDHGLAEGTVAEIFTAALESIAFVETDIRTAIERALTYVPADSRVATTIRLVMEKYDAGAPWLETRQAVVDYNGDWGAFQAPGNLGFVVMGLLYGEGDFLQSLLYAINCGDDTDCTAATVGAFLGILKGTAGIPSDLTEYIGDRILTMSIDRSADWAKIFPETCTDLSERIICLLPTVMLSHSIALTCTDGAADGCLYPENAPHAPLVPHYRSSVEGFMSQSPYSFSVEDHGILAIVHYEGEPYIKPNGQLTVAVELRNPQYDAQWLEMQVHIPAGWTADYQKSVCFLHRSSCSTGPRGLGHVTGRTSWQVTFTAGETVEAVNRIPVMIEIKGYPMPLCIPLTVLG